MKSSEHIKFMQTEKDLWTEMSIREICTQAHFADIAFINLTMKGRSCNDTAFSSIHSFLSHCVMVSKMLGASYSTSSGTTIGEILGILPSSIIHDRTFRNHLEHYDERLKRWIGQKGAGINIGTYNIGPKKAFQGVTFISHWDPNTNTYTFVDKDTDLPALHGETLKIKGVSDSWVQQLH